MYTFTETVSQFANIINKFLPETSVETRKAAVTLILEYIEQDHLPSGELVQPGGLISSILKFYSKF